MGRNFAVACMYQLDGRTDGFCEMYITTSTTAQVQVIH